MIQWDLDSLTIGGFSDADEAKYESDYGRDFEEVKRCDVTCSYEYNGTGNYTLTFVTCKCMDKYYVLDVMDRVERSADYGSFTVEDSSSCDGRYQDGKWTKDSSAVKPDYIVSKYEK